MRCNRLLVDWTNHRDLHVRRFPPVRNIVNPFDKDGISPESSASAAVRWDTHKPAAQSQMRRYHSNCQNGTCNPILSNKETIIHHRETPFRPEPHPYRSECNSSGHQFILIDWSIWTSIILGLISFYTSYGGYHGQAGHAAWRHDTTGTTDTPVDRTTDSPAISDRYNGLRMQPTLTGHFLLEMITWRTRSYRYQVHRVRDTGSWMDGWSCCRIPRGFGFFGDRYVTLFVSIAGSCRGTGGDIGVMCVGLCSVIIWLCVS